MAAEQHAEDLKVNVKKSRQAEGAILPNGLAPRGRSNDIKTLREITSNHERALNISKRKMIGKAPTPVDHKAAAQKLNDIIRMTSNKSEHADLIKSLPSFKDGKSQSFVKQMEKQRNLVS